MRIVAGLLVAALLAVGTSCHTARAPWSGGAIRSCPVCEDSPAVSPDDFERASLHYKLTCLGEVPLSERTASDERIARFVWSAGLVVPVQDGWLSSIGSATLERHGADCSIVLGRLWHREDDPAACVMERRRVGLTPGACGALAACTQCAQHPATDIDTYQMETWTGGYARCSGDQFAECYQRWKPLLDGT